MGWNPQLSFKLRDDQVAFGDLIIDKNGAQFLAEMLLEIKNGAVPDLGLMKSVLDDYCYTDEEFASLRDEMVKIQEDIKEFKSIGSNTLQKWNVFMQTIAVHTNYAIGSDTWIERYKELKMIAANMFDGIVKCGYKFEEERLKQLHERYDEIIGCTNGMERVGNYLQRQYKEAVLNGDENALDNYCNSMVETGVWTQEVADRERRKHAMNDLLNAAEGKKEYQDTLKERQKSRSAITVTWDMWKTMCERVDDCDPNSVPIEDIQKAEQILDYICTIYASEAGINVDDMKIAHRTSQLINLGVATVNTTKYKIEKEDYEFIMSLKTRQEAIREKANDGYEQITQDLINKMLSAIDAAGGGAVPNSTYLEANGILADVYNEINNECEVVDTVRNSSTTKDFMVLMRTAMTSVSTGPLLDSACIMYPKSKIDKFFKLCYSYMGSDYGNTEALNVTYANANLSMEESMLLDQTSGNIDVDAVRLMIENGRFALNASTLKVVYERIANWIDTKRECSIELVTALYNIVNACYNSLSNVMDADTILIDAVNKLRGSMNAGTGAGTERTSIVIMHDIIDYLIRRYNVSTDVSAEQWNIVIRETYIQKDGLVECMDFRILQQNMSSNWTGNYTWCVNIQKALFAYLTSVDQYASSNHKSAINEALAMTGDFLKNEPTTFEEDQALIGTIISLIESLDEIRHLKIAIDPDVYRSIFFYMDSGKTSLMNAAMEFLDPVSNTLSISKMVTSEETSEEKEEVAISQKYIVSMSTRIPDAFDRNYMTALSAILIMYLQGIQNWAPASSCDDANKIISQLKSTLMSNGTNYFKSDFTGIIALINRIQNIESIQVMVPVSLYDFVLTSTITDTVKNLLDNFINENVPQLSVTTSGMQSSEKSYMIYEDYIYAIAEMDATEVPVDAIPMVITLMTDIVNSVSETWSKSGLDEEIKTMRESLKIIENNLSPMLFGTAWASAGNIAKMIINHMNIYPDVYTDADVFDAIFPNG